jgi:hypothetical protein
MAGVPFIGGGITRRFGYVSRECCSRSTIDMIAGGRQVNAQLLHDRPEVSQEIIEGLLAFSDIEDLKLTIFTAA